MNNLCNERIEGLMVSKKITAEQLLQKTGYDVSSVKNNYSVDIISKLCDVLETTKEYIFDECKDGDCLVDIIGDRLDDEIKASGYSRTNLSILAFGYTSAITYRISSKKIRKSELETISWYLEINYDYFINESVQKIHMPIKTNPSPMPFIEKINETRYAYGETGFVVFSIRTLYDVAVAKGLSRYDIINALNGALKSEFITFMLKKTSIRIPTKIALLMANSIERGTPYTNNNLDEFYAKYCISNGAKIMEEKFLNNKKYYETDDEPVEEKKKKLSAKEYHELIHRKKNNQKEAITASAETSVETSIGKDISAHDLAELILDDYEALELAMIIKKADKDKRKIIKDVIIAILN